MQRILSGDTASLLCGLVRERQPQRDPVLCADRTRDMPFAGQVFSKLDVTRFERDLLASSTFDFSTAAECDDVLAAAPDANPAPYLPQCGEARPP